MLVFNKAGEPIGELAKAVNPEAQIFQVCPQMEPQIGPSAALSRDIPMVTLAVKWWNTPDGHRIRILRVAAGDENVLENVRDYWPLTPAGGEVQSVKIGDG